MSLNKHWPLYVLENREVYSECFPGAATMVGGAGKILKIDSSRSPENASKEHYLVRF